MRRDRYFRDERRLCSFAILAFLEIVLGRCRAGDFCGCGCGCHAHLRAHAPHRRSSLLRL